jgi:hypothetical protein
MESKTFSTINVTKATNRNLSIEREKPLWTYALRLRTRRIITDAIIPNQNVLDILIINTYPLRTKDARKNISQPLRILGMKKSICTQMTKAHNPRGADEDPTRYRKAIGGNKADNQ